MNAGDELEGTIAEYHDTLDEIIQDCQDNAVLPWDPVEQQLVRISGWTEDAAREVTTLAREYGGFMLRNALAVAKVLNVEDGELGY